MERCADKELLQSARNYLDITWDDPDGDLKLYGILTRGMKYLDGIAGAALDYTAEDAPRALLFDYVRYVRADALNEFQLTYLHELIGLQMNTGMKDESADV